MPEVHRPATVNVIRASLEMCSATREGALSVAETAAQTRKTIALSIALLDRVGKAAEAR